MGAAEPPTKKKRLEKETEKEKKEKRQREWADCKGKLKMVIKIPTTISLERHL